MTRKYFTCAETAKLIRTDLKTAFPGVKFSVRSSVYAGGASITCRWENGPTTAQVDDVIAIYQSRGFDGMIDYEYCKTAWLMPDGTITRAFIEGTEGCRGTVSEVRNPKPHEDAQEVSFGASYVFAEREVTEDHKAAKAAEIAQKYGIVIGDEKPWNIQVPQMCCYLSDLVHRAFAKQALPAHA